MKDQKLDKQKILFVTCVNDESLYDICVKHIKNLSVPENVKVEFLPVREARSLAEGYNSALNHDAKYKVYLHQDVFILNTNFIHEVMEVFQNNPRLGLFGVAGTRTLPNNGVWWEAKDQDLIGKVIGFVKDTYVMLRLQECEKEYEPVESLDGLIMVTQYDIPWRSDLFKGFHFYDASQSAEFLERGYDVGVVRQQEPWCLHYHKDHFDQTEYRLNQKQFLRHYLKHDITDERELDFVVSPMYY